MISSTLMIHMVTKSVTKVLRAVSDVIAGNVPSEGYVCRWGGEEILFVVPNTDTESCEKIAKEHLPENT